MKWCNKFGIGVDLLDFNFCDTHLSKTQCRTNRYCDVCISKSIIGGCIENNKLIDEPWEWLRIIVSGPEMAQYDNDDY